MGKVINPAPSPTVLISVDVNVFLTVIISGAAPIAFMLPTVAVLVGLPCTDVSVIKTRSPDVGVIVG